MTPDQEQALRTAQHLAAEAGEFVRDGRWHDALQRRQQALEFFVDILGEKSAEADGARDALFEVLTVVCRHEEARNVMLRCLEARREAIPVPNFLVVDALNKIGETHRREGNLQQAETHYREALEVLAKLPPDPGRHGTILSNQARVYADRGDPLRAEALWTEAVKLKRQASNRSVSLAASLASLGAVHHELGKVSDAERELREALDILVCVAPNHPFRIIAANSLSNVLYDQGRTRDALANCRAAIRELIAQRGSEDLEVLALRRHEAEILRLEQNHAAALAILDECLLLLDRTGRANHPFYVSLQLSKIDRLLDLGDSQTARTLAESIVEGRISAGTIEDAIAWSARERLAHAALHQGELELARSNLIALLQFRRDRASASPRDLEHLVASLLSFTRFSRILGRHDEAERSLTEVLEIIDQRLGRTHRLAIDMWSEAAMIADRKGDPKGVLVALDLAHLLILQTLGPGSLRMAQHLAYRAELLSRNERSDAALAQARGAFEAASNLVTPGSPAAVEVRYILAKILCRFGFLDEAASHFERVLTAHSEARSLYTATVRQKLALLELERGNVSAAVRHATDAAQDLESLWTGVLRFGSENDRMAWQSQHDFFGAAAALAQYDPGILANSVLRFKAVVLDSLIEDSQIRASDGRVSGIGSKLLEARRERYCLELAAFRRATAFEDQLLAARAKVEQLESELAKRIASFGHSRVCRTTNLDDVRAALVCDEVLVEFVRFDASASSGPAEPMFGALVIRPDRESPHWVHLGAAEGPDGIGTAVVQIHEIMRQVPAPEAATITRALKRLHDLVWLPISRLLPDFVRRATIAPDAELGLLSFAALWRGNGFLGEDMAFTYVTTGRDLLLQAPAVSGSKRIRIVAAPAYDTSLWHSSVAASAQRLRRWLRQSLTLRSTSEATSDRLDPYADLPNTLKEARLIAETAAKRGFADVEMYTGSAASEAAFRNLPPPYVLHVATHGTALSNPIPVDRPVQDDYAAEFMTAFYAEALSTGNARGALHRVQGRLLSEYRTSEGPGRAARLAGGFVISSHGRSSS